MQLDWVRFPLWHFAPWSSLLRPYNQGRSSLGRTHAWLLPKSADSTPELPPVDGGEGVFPSKNQPAPFCTHTATVATSQALEAKKHLCCMQALRASGSGVASYPQHENYDSNSQQHLYDPFHFLYTLLFLNLRQKHKSLPSVYRLLNIHLSPWQHLNFCFDSPTSTKNFVIVFS